MKTVLTFDSVYRSNSPETSSYGSLVSKESVRQSQQRYSIAELYKPQTSRRRSPSANLLFESREWYDCCRLLWCLVLVCCFVCAFMILLSFGILGSLHCVIDFVLFYCCFLCFPQLALSGCGTPLSTLQFELKKSGRQYCKFPIVPL